MSDIYLQITETPTVVTLSAPVISGALSSTVTVANTVTVALDANSLSALENVTVTVGAAITGTVTVSNFPTSQAVTFSSVSISNLPATQAVSLVSVPTHGVTLASTTVTVSSLPALAAGTAQIGSVTASISGTVPVSGTFFQATQPVSGTFFQGTQPVSLTTLPALVAGTAQIGSVTASISGTVPVSGTFFQATQPASLTSLPALAAGTNQIGSVTASISGTVPISISSVTVGNSVTISSLPAISGTVTANTFALQGTAVTTSNFTSTTASTVLASYNATREVLTIFNEGAGNLHIAPGATCTTIAYQVRLSAGDYYEVPNHQTTITHSAVFATAGTARVTQVS
jgi:hypothetical protein